MEAVAPQPLLGLPLGRDCQLREPEREFEGQLTGRQTSRGSQCGCGNGRRNRRRTGHDAFGTSCPNAGPGRRRGARSVARWKCRPGAVRTAELQPLGGSLGRGARGRLGSDSRLSAELLDSPSLTKTDSCRLREARSRQEGPSPPTRLSPAKRSPESSRPAGSGTFGTTAGLSFAPVRVQDRTLPELESISSTSRPPSRERRVRASRVCHVGQGPARLAKRMWHNPSAFAMMQASGEVAGATGGFLRRGVHRAVARPVPNANGETDLVRRRLLPTPRPEHREVGTLAA